jgi:MFS family permease
MHYALAVWRLLPFYLAGVLRLAPGAGGLLFMLTPVGTAVAAPLAGWATDRYGSRSPGVAGLGREAVGLFAISRFDAQTPLGARRRRPALVRLGLGAFQVPNVAQMMGAFPRGQQGAAGGVAFLSRTLGIVAGVEVAAGLFDARAASLGFAAAFQGAAAVCAGAVLLALIPAAAVGRGAGAPRPRRRRPRP